MERVRGGWCRGAFAVLLALLAGACSSAPFRGPEVGGKPWLEVTSEHFNLKTSQSESEARDTLTELERTHAVFEQVAFRVDEGIRLATRAVRLDSSCFYCYAVGSDLLAQRGDWQAAVVAFRTAVLLNGDRTSKVDRERLRELETKAEAAKRGAGN